MFYHFITHDVKGVINKALKVLRKKPNGYNCALSVVLSEHTGQ